MAAGDRGDRDSRTGGDIRHSARSHGEIAGRRLNLTITGPSRGTPHSFRRPFLVEHHAAPADAQELALDAQVIELVGALLDLGEARVRPLARLEGGGEGRVEGSGA